MKILFTGGGSGGHFYPIIAISKEINEIAKKEKALPPVVAELMVPFDVPSKE
jgi:hypothetical protein